jgi:hypothetical protein
MQLNHIGIEQGSNKKTSPSSTDIPRRNSSFPKVGRAYELRCGQLYARTIVALADRRHTGCAEYVVLGDTCMAPRFTGS